MLSSEREGAVLTSLQAQANLSFYWVSRVLSEVVQVVKNYSLAHDRLPEKFLYLLSPTTLTSITEKNARQTGKLT